MKALTYEHPEAPDPERLSAAAAEAQARLIEETEEWEIADEEGGDGGSAVKLLPAAEMAQARAFQQGLNRAMKAEEKSNRNYGRSSTKPTWRDRHSGKGTKGYDANYPSLKPSVEGEGEIKYHAANEKKMREKAAQYQDDDYDDDWGIIRETDGKGVVLNDGADEQNQNHANPHGNNTTIISHGNNRDPDYIPPHKRALQNRTLKEADNKPRPHNDDNDDCGEDLIMLQDKPKDTPPPPLPPQHLMARLKLLDVDADDHHDGGVPLS